ncbi:hypothetical protein [Rufibacter hautae]|uniref:Uncharacterized protein n=1 Tax=Rufibacter hautae TaxID=2595005 RepID=A0A5B6TGV2_9BACT|nr:hypothetical protein [Rufibacter hautae]KAA3438484.1 hypothetical protein FOA19_14715 [Rufibacter hautae]
MEQLIYSYQQNPSDPLSDVVTVYFEPDTKTVSTLNEPYSSQVVSPPPVEGQVVYSICDATPGSYTKDVVKFSSTRFRYLPEENSVDCGYTSGGSGPTYSADGTFIRNQCYGVNQYQVVANGTGGERQGALVKANATECGYVAPVVSGCTNPLASNYNPLATVDDGSCVIPPAQYHAVGGVLPNPIEYSITVDPLLNGTPKKNHFIRATIHRLDYSVIGTMQARVRNGKATLEVSSYLRPLVGTEITTAVSQVAEQAGAVEPFYLKYKEHYNGLESAEVTLASPVRLAVESALDKYSGSLEPYVLRESDTLPAFTTPYKNPVCFSGLPFEVSMLIDASMAGKPMFFERRYIDACGSELEILSTPIPDAMAGKMARLRMDAFPLDCAWKVELSIVDTDRSYHGSCPVAEGIKIFDNTFDFSFKRVIVTSGS